MTSQARLLESVGFSRNDASATSAELTNFTGGLEPAFVWSSMWHTSGDARLVSQH